LTTYSQIQLLEGAEQQIRDVPSEANEPEWNALIEAKPEIERREAGNIVREFVARHYNYAAREGHNRRLGERGEEFVFRLEKNRLASLGRIDLANEVEWTSKTHGDGAGYDIRSFNVMTDRELFIEVKTTNSGKYQPFMISDNEVAFSEEHAPQYALYRLFQFKDNPRLFNLEGDLHQHVNLLVREYTATFK